METVEDFKQDLETIKQFLREFTYVDEDDQVVPKYVPVLTKIANKQETVLTVELADLEMFNQSLSDRVVSNTSRFKQLFLEALDVLLPELKTSEPEEKDIMDVFIEQRLFVERSNQQQIQQQGLNPTNATSTTTTNLTGNNPRVDHDQKYPADLIRKFEVYFKPTTLLSIPIRDVRAEFVGHLVTVRGIVTRASDVKPKITIATYTCDQCGCESYQPVKGLEYTPLFECSSAPCKALKNVSRLNFQMRGSKFVKYQEIKLQEHSDQVPTGHIPRTITVIAQGEQTRRCAPGDHISVSGVFLPFNHSGFRARTNAFGVDTYIEANYITRMNKTEDDEQSREALTDEAAQELVKKYDNFQEMLSQSIAPEIYGHHKLKLALLLLLVGGVDKTSHGLKIRGNINVLLMGDPGVAKSQLLSFIDRLALRSQYTTGRGSSGVGLTAAVLKDPITNELVLEGGALVLADQGICCIDEFDKMMDADRTAIHEVMEQQTVSIAKAGIMTTLNARVSILAAANPAYGRFVRDRSVTDNLQIPAALLSRFDLLWLIRDVPDQQKDLALAEHVTNIHANLTLLARVGDDVIDMKTMRRYISLCKTKQPNVPERLVERFVDIYLGIRERSRLNDDGKDCLFTSPRSLLAIIRLSTAFARLRLSDEVNESDIDAAFDIYKCSRESIEESNSSENRGLDAVTIIRAVSRDLDSMEMPFEAVKLALTKAGYSFEEIDKVITKLENYDTLTYDRESDKITLIQI